MLDRIKKSRLSLKLFSVVLAIAAWLIITYTINPTINYRVRNVPVTFTGAEELSERGLVLTNENEINSVSVTIRGPRSSVINALAAISARADISDITSEGSKTTAVTVDLGVTGVYTVDRIAPNVTVKIDRLVERDIPIKIVQTGTEKDKQTIIASESDEDKITLRGAKSELDNVKFALVSIDISAIEGTVVQSLPYTTVNAEDMRIGCNTLVDPPSEISVTSVVYPRKTVSVRAVLPEKDRGDWALNIKSISRDKIDVGVGDEAEPISELLAVYEPSSYRTGQEEYTLYIKQPSGIYIPEAAQSIVARLTLEKKIVKPTELAIEVRSVSQGRVATLATDSAELVLRGAESKLTKDNVKAYVDASGLGVGSYELEIQLDTSEDITLEETAKVKVTIE